VKVVGDGVVDWVRPGGASPGRATLCDNRKVEAMKTGKCGLWPATYRMSAICNIKCDIGPLCIIVRLCIVLLRPDCEKRIAQLGLADWRGSILNELPSIAATTRLESPWRNDTT
jgi:hypothetical protein